MRPPNRFRLPAEWEPLAAVWLSWPKNPRSWAGRQDRIDPVFAEFACQIAATTPVRILAPHSLQASAGAALNASPLFDPSLDIQLLAIPSDDCWIRDYGPIFVRDLQADRWAVAGFRFNAWGGKYPPWDDDAAAAQRISEHLGVPFHRWELCLEGGGLETDGRGRLLTTLDCIVTPTRNPGWSRTRIAAELQRTLGIDEILWLDQNGPADPTPTPRIHSDSPHPQPFLVGDDTDGHIDQIARFLDPENVVVATCDDPADPNFTPLRAAWTQLQSWASQTSPRVTVHALPTPPPRVMEGVRVPESYCNFLRLGIDRLLLPSFGVPAADDHAAGVIAAVLPHARIDRIDCRELVWGFGALHCASRDQPA